MLQTFVLFLLLPHYRYNFINSLQVSLQLNRTSSAHKWYHLQKKRVNNHDRSVSVQQYYNLQIYKRFDRNHKKWGIQNLEGQFGNKRILVFHSFHTKHLRFHQMILDQKTIYLISKLTNRHFVRSVLIASLSIKAFCTKKIYKNHFL